MTTYTVKRHPLSEARAALDALKATQSKIASAKTALEVQALSESIKAGAWICICHWLEAIHGKIGEPQILPAKEPAAIRDDVQRGRQVEREAIVRWLRLPSTIEAQMGEGELASLIAEGKHWHQQREKPL